MGVGLGAVTTCGPSSDVGELGHKAVLFLMLGGTCTLPSAAAHRFPSPPTGQEGAEVPPLKARLLPSFPWSLARGN